MNDSNSDSSSQNFNSKNEQLWGCVEVLEHSPKSITYAQWSNGTKIVTWYLVAWSGKDPEGKPWENSWESGHVKEKEVPKLMRFYWNEVKSEEDRKRAEKNLKKTPKKAVKKTPTKTPKSTPRKTLRKMPNSLSDTTQGTPKISIVLDSLGLVKTSESPVSKTPEPSSQVKKRKLIEVKKKDPDDRKISKIDSSTCRLDLNNIVYGSRSSRSPESLRLIDNNNSSKLRINTDNEVCSTKLEAEDDALDAKNMSPTVMKQQSAEDKCEEWMENTETVSKIEVTIHSDTNSDMNLDKIADFDASVDPQQPDPELPELQLSEPKLNERKFPDPQLPDPQLPDPQLPDPQLLDHQLQDQSKTAPTDQISKPKITPPDFYRQLLSQSNFKVMTITLESNSVSKRVQTTQQIQISHVEGSKNCNVNYLHNASLNDDFSMQTDQIDTVFLDRVKKEMLKKLGVEPGLLKLDDKNDASSEKNSEENSPDSEISFIKSVHNSEIVRIDSLEDGEQELEMSLQIENPNRECAKPETKPENSVQTVSEKMNSEPINSDPINLVKPVSLKPTSSNPENPDQTNLKPDSSKPTQLNSNKLTKHDKSWRIDVEESHIDSAKKLIKAITRNREKYKGKRFEYEFTGDPHWHQKKNNITTIKEELFMTENFEALKLSTSYFYNEYWYSGDIINTLSAFLTKKQSDPHNENDYKIIFLDTYFAETKSDEDTRHGLEKHYELILEDANRVDYLSSQNLTKKQLNLMDKEVRKLVRYKHRSIDFKGNDEFECNDECDDKSSDKTDTENKKTNKINELPDIEYNSKNASSDTSDLKNVSVYKNIFKSPTILSIPVRVRQFHWTHCYVDFKKSSIHYIDRKYPAINDDQSDKIPSKIINEFEIWTTKLGKFINDYMLDSPKKWKYRIACPAFKSPEKSVTYYKEKYNEDVAFEFIEEKYLQTDGYSCGAILCAQMSMLGNVGYVDYRELESEEFSVFSWQLAGYFVEKAGKQADGFL